MFDVFYIGTKPNQFAHEREVTSVEQAQELSRTRYFWIIHYLCDYSDFDFLWEPKPWEAHQRHVYASQWNKDSGTWLCPKVGYTDTQYHAGMIAIRKPCFDNWDHLDVEGFDYSWHPDPTEPPFIYRFGTQWQKTGGPTYTVPGAVNIKYVAENRVNKTSVDEYWDNLDYKGFDYTWHPDLTEGPHIYQFGTQWQKTGGPRYIMPGATVVKYVSEPRCTKTSVDNNWVIPDGVGEFDYTWHPDSSEPPMNYQFGTQWQKTGGPLYKVNGATETKYVSQIKVENISISRNVYLIDHGNPETNEVIKILEDKGCTIKKKARFISSYKGTLQRILNQEECDFVWVCSSVCDYSNFDFSWHPEQWQGTMLHVFASETQKFGDTFLINVPSFNARIKTTEILEWYDTLHFVDNISVPRWPLPVVQTDGNSIVDAVKEHTFIEPLTLFTDKPNLQSNIKIPTVNLWREKTRTITPLSTGHSTVIVPRDSKTHVFGELYDYPYIDKTCSSILIDEPLDIVFISNGEKNAEKNWEHLQHITRSVPNRLIRIDGVQGRLAAYKAASDASNTPWAFNVFAKLHVDENFNWSWQPDRMQKNKHYIFHAYNPLVDVEYGYASIIAYHKGLVAQHEGKGLDFTLDQEHEVVPIRSGITYYEDDKHTAWRSAFREAIKLHKWVLESNDMEFKYRLKKWCTSNGTETGDWSARGANDGVEYYNKVNGDFDSLKLSYDWDFLNNYFKDKYGDI